MPEITFYHCEGCCYTFVRMGNSGGAPTCCGREAKELKANTVDAPREKHVPIITKEGGKIKVRVGSVPHPMLPEHHIEWTALVTESKLQFEFLKPGMEPVAEFEDAGSGTVFEYCNLHGLWKADF
jgi:superoxide reductase